MKPRTPEIYKSLSSALNADTRYGLFYIEDWVQNSMIVQPNSSNPANKPRVYVWNGGITRKQLDGLQLNDIEMALKMSHKMMKILTE